MNEPELQGGGLELTEFVGVVIANHRSMTGRGYAVLPDREDFASDAPQFPEGGDQLVPVLAEADHHSRLGWNARRVPARPLEQLQRARVPAARPRHAIETRNGLRVVI